MNTMILVSMTVILFSGQLYAQTTESSDIWEPFNTLPGRGLVTKQALPG